MTIDEILEEIVTACKDFNVNRVILYGSFAKGLQSTRSDIDIAIDYDDELDYWGLKDRIDSIETLRRIDILDLKQKNINSLLLEDIREYGKVLYQKI